MYPSISDAREDNIRRGAQMHDEIEREESRELSSLCSCARKPVEDEGCGGID